MSEKTAQNMLLLSEEGCAGFTNDSASVEKLQSCTLWCLKSWLLFFLSQT